MSDKMPLTLADVQECVDDLFAENGKTTTLEIKRQLREVGFFAVQQEVAIAMYTLWPMFGWHWTFNGTYRTYYPDHQTALDAYNENPIGIEQTSWLGWLVPQVDPDLTIQADLVDTPTVDKADLVDGAPEETKTPSPGDWMAFSYSCTEPPAYITGVTLVTANGGTREQARMAVRNVVRNFYSQLADVKYADVGANIIK